MKLDAHLASKHKIPEIILCSCGLVIKGEYRRKAHDKLWNSHCTELNEVIKTECEKKKVEVFKVDQRHSYVKVTTSNSDNYHQVSYFRKDIATNYIINNFDHVIAIRNFVVEKTLGEGPQICSVPSSSVPYIAKEN
jgi:hypothetical protein